MLDDDDLYTVALSYLSWRQHEQQRAQKRR